MVNETPITCCESDASKIDSCYIIFQVVSFYARNQKESFTCTK